MRRGDEASGASGLTIGILEAVDVAAQTIRVGGRIFRVGYRERLQQFPRWVGQHVTVARRTSSTCCVPTSNTSSAR